MAQVNINSTPTPNYPDSQPTYTTPPVAYDDSAGARSAATNNLTWAIGLVVIIAAIAIAIVFVAHNVHP